MIYLLIAVALLAACSRVSSVPNRAATDYRCDDPALATAFMRAVKEWADRGVYAAQIVTMNEAPEAVPVRRVPRSSMVRECQNSTAGAADGCTAYADDWYRQIVVPDDVIDPVRLHVVLLHELGHIFSASRDHLPADVSAVMHPNATSVTVTEADVAFVCERAPCDESVA